MPVLKGYTTMSSHGLPGRLPALQVHSFPLLSNKLTIYKKTESDAKREQRGRPRKHTGSTATVDRLTAIPEDKPSFERRSTSAILRPRSQMQLARLQEQMARERQKAVQNEMKTALHHITELLNSFDDIVSVELTSYQHVMRDITLEIQEIVARHKLELTKFEDYIKSTADHGIAVGYEIDQLQEITGSLLKLEEALYRFGVLSYRSSEIDTKSAVEQASRGSQGLFDSKPASAGPPSAGVRTKRVDVNVKDKVDSLRRSIALFHILTGHLTLEQLRDAKGFNELFDKLQELMRNIREDSRQEARELQVAKKLLLDDRETLIYQNETSNKKLQQMEKERQWLENQVTESRNMLESMRKEMGMLSDAIRYGADGALLQKLVQKHLPTLSQQAVSTGSSIGSLLKHRVSPTPSWLKALKMEDKKSQTVELVGILEDRLEALQDENTKLQYEVKYLKSQVKESDRRRRSGSPLLTRRIGHRLFSSLPSSQISIDRTDKSVASRGSLTLRGRVRNVAVQTQSKIDARRHSIPKSEAPSILPSPEVLKPVVSDKVLTDGTVALSTKQGTLHAIPKMKQPSKFGEVDRRKEPIQPGQQTKLLISQGVLTSKIYKCNAFVQMPQQTEMEKQLQTSVKALQQEVFRLQLRVFYMRRDIEGDSDPSKHVILSKDVDTQINVLKTQVQDYGKLSDRITIIEQNYAAKQRAFEYMKTYALSKIEELDKLLEKAQTAIASLNTEKATLTAEYEEKTGRVMEELKALEDDLLNQTTTAMDDDERDLFIEKNHISMLEAARRLHEIRRRHHSGVAKLEVKECELQEQIGLIQKMKTCDTDIQRVTVIDDAEQHALTMYSTEKAALIQSIIEKKEEFSTSVASIINNSLMQDTLTVFLNVDDTKQRVNELILKTEMTCDAMISIKQKVAKQAELEPQRLAILNTVVKALALEVKDKTKKIGIISKRQEPVTLTAIKYLEDINYVSKKLQTVIDQYAKSTQSVLEVSEKEQQVFLTEIKNLHSMLTQTNIKGLAEKLIQIMEISKETKDVGVQYDQQYLRRFTLPGRIYSRRFTQVPIDVSPSFEFAKATTQKIMPKETDGFVSHLKLPIEQEVPAISIPAQQVQQETPVLMAQPPIELVDILPQNILEYYQVKPADFCGKITQWQQVEQIPSLVESDIPGVYHVSKMLPRLPARYLAEINSLHEVIEYLENVVYLQRDILRFSSVDVNQYIRLIDSTISLSAMEVTSKRCMRDFVLRMTGDSKVVIPPEVVVSLLQVPKSVLAGTTSHLWRWDESYMHTERVQDMARAIVQRRRHGSKVKVMAKTPARRRIPHIEGVSPLVRQMLEEYRRCPVSDAGAERVLQELMRLMPGLFQSQEHPTSYPEQPTLPPTRSHKRKPLPPVTLRSAPVRARSDITSKTVTQKTMNGPSTISDNRCLINDMLRKRREDYWNKYRSLKPSRCFSKGSSIRGGHVATATKVDTADTLMPGTGNGRLPKLARLEKKVLSENILPRQIHTFSELRFYGLKSNMHLVASEEQQKL